MVSSRNATSEKRYDDRFITPSSVSGPAFAAPRRVPPTIRLRRAPVNAGGPCCQGACIGAWIQIRVIVLLPHEKRSRICANEVSLRLLQYGPARHPPVGCA